MASSNPQFAWQNGEIIPWEDAVVHVRTDSFMRGANVFEGIRAYASDDKQQLYVFRNPEHMDRLFNSSMKALRLQIKWNAEQITEAMLEVLRRSKMRNDTHIRPTAYYGIGEAFGFDPAKISMEAVITAEERPAKPSLWTGKTAKVSSWRRIEDDVMPPRIKAAANYLNSRYALMDARIDGYDEAIFLTRNGKVSESSGACLMMVRGGKVIAPPVTEGILESVTRSTLIELFQRELGIQVVEREVDRTELYIADEVFLCGTGDEVQPIVSVDKHMVGNGERGPVVNQIQDLYFDVVRGKNSNYHHWLLPVY